jgi:hypothetical protein
MVANLKGVQNLTWIYPPLNQTGADYLKTVRPLSPPCITLLIFIDPAQSRQRRRPPRKSLDGDLQARNRQRIEGWNISR